MTGRNPKLDEDRVDGRTAADDEAAAEAVDDILSPAMPPAGAGIAIENDPRLNRPSETEAELKELVESNEAAAEEAGDEP